MKIRISEFLKRFSPIALYAPLQHHFWSSSMKMMGEKKPGMQNRRVEKNKDGVGLNCAIFRYKLIVQELESRPGL